MPYGVVYLITNLANGKYYVGQTTNLYRRTWDHSHPKDRDTRIAHAVRKYGWDNFRMEVLGEADDADTLNNLENLWIVISNAVECGYNSQTANHGPSVETRRKMSDAQKRNPSRYWVGKKRPDTSARNKAFFTGRPSPKKLPEKPKLPRRNYNGDNNPFFGKTHSDEARSKMSLSVKQGIAAHLSSSEGKEHQRNASLARWAKFREAKNAGS